MKKSSLPKNLFFLVLGAALAFLWTTSPLSKSHKVEKHNAITSLYPITSILIERDDYAISYDGSNKIPHWSFEHLTKKSLSKQAKRNPKEQFQADHNIPPHLQSSNVDFYKSGYDRGHMAAAGNHQQSKRRLKETFYLSNIAPQDPGFNRFYWKTLEEYTRLLTKEYDDVYVVSGTTFLHKDRLNESGKKIRSLTYEVIGENQIGVPNAFYKVILAKGKKGEPLYKAYLLPNAFIEGDPPFEKYTIPIGELEQITGVLFFPDEQKPLPASHLTTSLLHFSQFDKL